LDPTPARRVFLAFQWFLVDTDESRVLPGRGVLMGFLKRVSEFLTVPSPLSAAERLELTQCVETVRRGLQSFVEAGEALTRIKAKQLYREKHSSFEAFASAEFGLSGRRLDQLVESFGIMQTLKSVSPNVPTPKVEAAVRPLAGLSQVDQVEAYAEAVAASGGAAPTPRRVREAADKRRPKGKRLPKPTRFKVPGAVVTVTPNKAFGGVAAALLAALEQVDRVSDREAA
jgi:hypothetical protein